MTTHTLTYVPAEKPHHVHRECSCGYRSPWAWPAPKDPSNVGHCPEDKTVTHLVTLQFSWGGLFDGEPSDHLIHLVRGTRNGTPGASLCGIDRFAKDAPGWSVGGGVTGGGIVLKPCDGCADVARTEFPGLPVSGSVGGATMSAHLGVEVSR